MLMRALKHTVTEEGEILPGDLFFPGYFHNRETSLFTQDNPIAWTTPDIRAHQLITEGLAELLPSAPDLSEAISSEIEVLPEESAVEESHAVVLVPEALSIDVVEDSHPEE